MSVWVLVYASGWPEDGGHAVHGVYETLERCFREVARYCKGNSTAWGPDEGERHVSWRTGDRSRPELGSWWRAEQYEVEP